MRKIADYYVFRGEWIERIGPGWALDREMCNGDITGIPIYKALSDAQNAIRKRLDGTHTAEPRIVATAGFDVDKREYFVEGGTQNER